MNSREKTVAVKAAKEAGKILAKFFKKGFSVKKKGAIDLVTDADIAAQKKIVSIISKNFPRDEILAEEGAVHKKHIGRVWIVDPLDGTTNFAHRLPWFATSIGLFDGEEKLGVIFDPIQNELYSVEKGQGAFLNGKKIFVSKNREIIDSVLATGFPYDRGEVAQKTVRSIGSLVGECQGVRRFGSAVLDLAFVARGGFDGFFEYKLFPWDVCVGILLVREAGGKVTGIDGKPADSFSTHFLATNGLVHEKLMEKLEKP